MTQYESDNYYVIMITFHRSEAFLIGEKKSIRCVKEVHHGCVYELSAASRLGMSIEIQYLQTTDVLCLKIQ